MFAKLSTKRSFKSFTNILQVKRSSYLMKPQTCDHFPTMQPMCSYLTYIIGYNYNS